MITGPLSCRIVIGLTSSVLALAMWVSPAAATWSIVATDPETAEVGVAIASCVPGEALGELDRPLVPVVLLPGSAAAVTQAELNLSAPARIDELVAAGAAPSEIIEDITSNDFDQVAAIRQHAIVSIGGAAAAFTGTDTSPVALDRQDLGVSVQGNLLRSDAVVDDAFETFVADRGDGATLAEALVAALLAGSEAGGDGRCGDQTALFAHLATALPDDSASSPSTLLTVVVDEGDGQNPVRLLSDAFVTGERGVIDAGTATSSTGATVRTFVFVLAALMAVGAMVLVKRGLGSVAARR